MNKEIKENTRKAASVRLKDWCTFSVGEEDRKADYMEVTEWSNGEGFDIYISEGNKEKMYHLTSGQIHALYKLYKTIFKDR
jgi:hypothetical protein